MNQHLCGNVDCFSIFPDNVLLQHLFGDPYIGSNRDEIKKKNERIAELEKEVKRPRSEADRNSFSRSRDRARSE